MAKNASGAAFLNSKKRAEEMMLAQESGLDMRDGFSDQDIFNMQHHHLLNCLEKTTVSKEVSTKNKLLIALYIKALPFTSWRFLQFSKMSNSSIKDIISSAKKSHYK